MISFNLVSAFYLNTLGSRNFIHLKQDIEQEHESFRFTLRISKLLKKIIS
ncbi:hypothetical protein Cycma_4602 [Cyclobacterium marinum DSM 745]|uniref:Uncharacterized protein n=1 Tax=Cyclobacterium marinum (strain ATCC 25205 / DSM 745 / LMG 13164 / NCIMB 1802) TaxID=880070 RepID=G0J1S9_CYCMS|nr:hypothetical protein Cycma_4602 [Cyclobacterium marinum DSM 745]